MTLEVRRAADRFTTVAEGRSTAHSFSFGAHYDPGNVGHALLVAHNDDRLEPGHGYPLHEHRDVEVVTWVLEGSLVHEDSQGHAGVVRPGLVQTMSAGRGVAHSERNDAPGDGVPVRFVQMWLRPQQPGGAPRYDQGEVTLAPGRLVPLVSGDARVDAPARIRNTQASLHGARLPAGRAVRLPDAPYLHVFVARGSVDLEGAGTLAEADAVRVSGEGGQLLTARADAEVLVWEMHGR